VVQRYDAQGVLQQLDYVDGVPEGTPKFGPSGPRRGIDAPGDDVGRFTDVQSRGALTYVSYQDVTRGDLKLAIRDESGVWSHFVVDGATADLGYYTSLAVDSDGKVGIAYFQRGGDAAFNLRSCPGPALPASTPKRAVTALKWAKAKVAKPQSASDFDISVIDCQVRPLFCEGCTQTCADLGEGPACVAIADGCTDCDPETEVCVINAGNPRCAPRANTPEFAVLPDGVGLHPSVAFDGRVAYVTYLQRLRAKGSLYGVRISAEGAPGPRVLLDGSGDTGYFSSVRWDNTSRQLGVSYYDSATRSLKYWVNSALAAGAMPEVVDNGIGTGNASERSWVGADNALGFSASGEAVVVYQDSTLGNLKAAVRRSAGWQVLPPIRSEGAVGFFADIDFVGSQAWSSHARVRARNGQRGPRLDNGILLERLNLP
jgi:hypothetical protein